MRSLRLIVVFTNVNKSPIFCIQNFPFLFQVINGTSNRSANPSFHIQSPMQKFLQYRVDSTLRKKGLNEKNVCKTHATAIHWLIQSINFEKYSTVKYSKLKLLRIDSAKRLLIKAAWPSFYQRKFNGKIWIVIWPNCQQYLIES
jgi:hypothetical protein